MTGFLKSIAAAATLVAMSTFALADGMPGGSMKDAPMAGGCGIAAANFGGAYGGIQLGTGSYRSTVGIEDVLGISGTREEEGFVLGGVVGYNWQRCNTVIGLEGEFNWTDIDRKWGIDLTGLGFGPANIFNASSNMDFYGALKVKTGLAFDNLLVYVTSGIAFANIEHKGLDTIIGQVGFNESDTRWGWVVGAGTEYALTKNISWKNEATYTRFQDTDFNLTAGALLPGAAIKLNGQDELWSLRTGLNFRF